MLIIALFLKTVLIDNSGEIYLLLQHVLFNLLPVERYDGIWPHGFLTVIKKTHHTLTHSQWNVQLVANT